MAAEIGLGLSAVDAEIRGVRMLHADDMVAGIDVMHLAGDATRHVGEQIRRRFADVFNCHIAP